jgi:hypothetical protein
MPAATSNATTEAAKRESALLYLSDLSHGSAGVNVNFLLLRTRPPLRTRQRYVHNLTADASDSAHSERPGSPRKKNDFKDLRFIELFAGIGGGHIAMSQRGARCVFGSEFDAAAAETYERNYGIRPAGDITQIASIDIPAHDILFAGFPCQPFSMSGKREVSPGTIVRD